MHRARVFCNTPRSVQSLASDPLRRTSKRLLPPHLVFDITRTQVPSAQTRQRARVATPSEPVRGYENEAGQCCSLATRLSTGANKLNLFKSAAPKSRANRPKTRCGMKITSVWEMQKPRKQPRNTEISKLSLTLALTCVCHAQPLQDFRTRPMHGRPRELGRSLR